MKKYDFLKVREFISKNANDIESATLGMNEDWFWTANTVFEDGEFKEDLTEDTLIGGINSSSWATPTLEVYFKNGESDKFDCSIGEFTDDIVARLEKQFSVVGNLGCLSQPCQDGREDVSKKLEL